MDKEFVEWIYLKTIVGNFEALIHYYFGTMAYLAPWLRQAGSGLLYSLGLAWAAFCMFKAPVDRLQAGLGVLGMIFVAGFLNSPSTDTKNLGASSGTELTVGGYYSYYIAGSIAQVFQEVVEASWKNSINGAAGKPGGPTADAIALAFGNKAEQYAEKFLKGEGKAAVKDFLQVCGPAALQKATTPKEKAMLAAIGIGANTLGMKSSDTTEIRQYLAKERNNNGSFQSDNMLMLRESRARNQAKEIDEKRSEAESFLKELPVENTTIDGRTGYRIPTKDYYVNLLSENGELQDSGVDSFKSLSNSDSDFQKMTANGATTVQPKSESDYLFYPKDCFDLYKIANETMSSLRQGTKGIPGYEKLGLTAEYTSLFASNIVRRGLNDEINELLKKENVEGDVDSSFTEKLSDMFYDSSTKVSNVFDKWMLEYGIPVLVSTMAMLVAVLLITFPIFALISVMFGPKVLSSYFRLMAFPFLVVFVNNLILSLSANLIAFDKAYKIIPATMNPGGVDLPSAMSGMTTETMIYATICVCEIAIAKFILWDDFRAITSFNPAAAGNASAARGASMIGTAVSLVTGAFGRSAKIATASSNAKRAQATSAALTTISKNVSHIANGGNRSDNKDRSSPGGRGSQGGSGGGGGGGGGSSNSGAGGNGAGSKPLGSSHSLNPEPPTKPTIH